VAGRNVHAETRGRGRDVVLLHGASGNLRDFTFALTDRLVARGFRVTAFDRPGLGWSDDWGDAAISPRAQADILRAAASDIGLRRPVVVGHSYGAAVAMAWALADPRGTAAVVSLAGATMPWPGGLGPWYSITSSEIGGATVVPLISAFAPVSRADRAIAGIFAPDRVPPGYAGHIGAGLTLRRASLRANARQVNGLKPHVTAMAAEYPGLRLPVEILHGTADRIVPLAVHAEPMSRLLPAARLTALEGTGHMPHHARPDETVAAIERAARRSTA
jgi:pimeloyl-ACP methyl ester carboxylesterase